MDTIGTRGIGTWEPPARIAKDQILAVSQSVLALPDIAMRRTEHVFRIAVAEMEWDIGVMVTEPEDPARIPVGPDGRRCGFIMVHGGASDWRSIEPHALMLTRKKGFKVCNMTFPGRLWLDDPSRDWPGDTTMPDGSLRTPVWLKGEHISRDQYEVVTEASFRHIYGTRTFARARPGTRYWDRMAAWPLAFEAAMKEVCRRHMPEDMFSIFSHGHSTGGPFSHMILQRVPNIVGLTGIENSPFAFIFREMTGHDWPNPFADLLVRNWRELARYRGAELHMMGDNDALLRLPLVMEELFEQWDRAKRFPQIKAEYALHIHSIPALSAAARATAARLRLTERDTEALVARYIGYGRPLEGPGVKPIPPLLYCINKFSRDHTPEKYAIMAARYCDMRPTPKFRVIELGTGVHSYWRPEEGLPHGLTPVVAQLWSEAIDAGYYHGQR
ncbi:MAG: hypothetical protein FJX67_10435 [Alphaproteobacteria bacterium]|nr:hypothetical protein [Alphaproteobacteria bacterium]